MDSSDDVRTEELSSHVPGKKRFGSSIIYTLSHGIEIVTPLMPGQFLILATLANIGKSIGITAGALFLLSVCKS